MKKSTLALTRLFTCLGLALTLNLAHAQPPTSPAAPVPANGFLRVGAWNIENLGFRNAGKPDEQQKPENIATYIAASGVDVLALEEIHDDDQEKEEDFGSSPWRNSILDQVLPLLKKSTNADWRYELTDPKPDNERCQMTGVLWRTTRAELKDRWKLPIVAGKHPNTEETYWKRRPEAFYFASLGANKGDFVVVPVHMKSNKGSVGTDMRPIEAQQLYSCIPSLIDHFQGENDIILLGDTNINPAEQGVQNTWVTFRDLNSDDNITWNNPFSHFAPAPFDRIFVPKTQPEFTDSIQKIHGPYPAAGQTEKEWFTEHLKLRSDHLLIWCDIAVNFDND